MPECKYCNVELEIDTTKHVEIDVSGVYIYFKGYCPKCNKKFHWTEQYVFEKFDDLREEEWN